LLLAVSLFSGSLMKNYEPGKTYPCKQGCYLIFECPIGDDYSLEYEKSNDFTVETVGKFVVVRPHVSDSQLALRICNKQNRYIDTAVSCQPADAPGQPVVKVIVPEFPAANTLDLLTSSYQIESGPGLVSKFDLKSYLPKDGLKEKQTASRKNRQWVFDNAV